MKMRISIILMALALLVAYTIPAMSDDCAQQDGQSCGKDKASCAGECGGRSCDGGCGEEQAGSCGESCNGDCGESCGDGCGGTCGESCGNGCKGECSGNCESGRGGSGACAEEAACGGDMEYAPMHGWYRDGKGWERGMDMWRVDKKGYYLAEKRDLQRLIDEELKLCPYQKILLAEASDDYTLRAIDLQKLYFDDRTISIEDLNHRLTLLNHSYDRRSRMMLSQFQDAVYPEHMWMIYSSPAWSKGYHPGSSFVLRELLKEYERDFRKHHGMRGEWAEEWHD